MRELGFDRVAARLPLHGERLLALNQSLKAQASDIRFKSGQPVAVCGREGVFFLKESGGTARGLVPGLVRISPEEMRQLFIGICGHSVFSHEEEIRQGYVDMGGGCRAGVCGTTVVENGQVRGMRDVTSLVFRIPRDAPGCGDRLFLEGVDPLEGVLIVGEPASGKTTLLRDLARSMSLGRFGPSRRVAVLDNRGELSFGETGMDSAGFDLGPCADVLLGCPKTQAFHMAIRTLSPEIIVCDELAPEDLDAVHGAVFAGVGLVATVHGNRERAHSRPLCRQLLETGAFGTLVTLSGRGDPGKLYSIERVRPFKKGGEGS